MHLYECNAQEAKCDYCQQKFPDNVQAKMHMSYECTMNQSAMVKCRFCGFSFTKKDYVEEHIMICNDMVNIFKDLES